MCSEGDISVKWMLNYAAFPKWKPNYIVFNDGCLVATDGFIQALKHTLERQNTKGSQHGKDWLLRKQMSLEAYLDASIKCE